MEKGLIATAASIFLSFGLLFYLLPFGILLICAVVGALASAYFIVSIVLAGKSETITSTSGLSTLFVLFLLSPAIFAGILLYWNAFSPILVLLLTGLMHTFFYSFLTIPLSLYHRHLEEGAKEGGIPSLPISVLVPAYNEEGYVGRCIESLLEAEYPEGKKEVIVVDDGSTDGTYEEAKGYEDRGVKVVHKKNGGKYSALNYGLMFADGEVIVTVDADSIVARRSLLEVARRFQGDQDVAAVAGNVKIFNRKGFVTNCQALEYITSINLFRRALSIFGTVPVVPGVLGAFRREVLEGGGFYDPDTLTEDFDTTVKTLKMGGVVQATRTARTFTAAPETWGDLYKQRLRWYRGNFMTLLKHKDAFTNPRFGVLQKLTFPYLAISNILLPILGIVVATSIIITIISGHIIHLLGILSFFLLLQALISFLAVRIDEADWKLVAFSPLFVVGFKHFIDFVKLKSLADVLLGREMKWTRAERPATSVSSGEG